MRIENERIGVYLCECGNNIADAIDLDAVGDAIAKIPGVAIVKRHKLLCSGDGKGFLTKDIASERLTRVVVAACSPRDHWKTFARVCEDAGVNPYLYQIVNIREQCAWMIKDKAKATSRAETYIRSAVNRVLYQKPLFQLEIDSVPDVLVIGGGIAGIETALNLAGKNRKIYLVEKSDNIGGFARNLSEIYTDGKKIKSDIEEKIELIGKNPFVEIITNAEVEKAIGFFGNFEITVGKPDGKMDFKVGAIVVAIGFSEIEPPENFGSGLQNVFTASQIERMKKIGKIALADGSSPKNVALIHCVGRDEVGYCSGICCNYLNKISEYFFDENPEMKITHLYRDLCLPEKGDQVYCESIKQKGANFIFAENVRVEKYGDGLKIEYSSEPNKKGAITADMVVLAPPLSPSADSKKIAEMLDLGADRSGFIDEAHVHLNPVGTSIEGIFVAGCASGPRDISCSMTQALASVGAISATLIPGKKLLPEVAVSEVIDVLCTGCKTCVAVCPYGAVSYIEDEHVSRIKEAICRGCGNCAGSCPSGSIRARHFTTSQLHQEVIEAIF